MKIVLFGRDGLIGRELLRTLASLGDVIAPGHKEVDFEDRGRLHDALRFLGADVIVNAAGYTAVDQAEADEARAFRVNAHAVEVLADYARYNGSLLVHYSTDYVFDGKKETPYLETDHPNPLNAYGRSKRAGEQAIEQGGCHHFIFRTSWVHGVGGKNFVKTIWQQAREQEKLDVIADQAGIPTSAELIADVTALSIGAFFADLLPEGIHHLTASGETSWYGLACHVVKEMQKHGIQTALDVSEIRPVMTAQYPQPARRPLNSRLDNSQLSQQLGFALPEWPYHVDRTLAQLLGAERTP